VKVKVALLGAGIAAGWHLQNLARIESVEIAGICDQVQQRAEATARAWNVQPYVDLEEMLDREKPDALYICIPPYAHSGQEFLAIERGIHLLVEKPVHLDLAQGERIARAIEQQRIISSSGYHWRYYNTVEAARATLQERSIGLVMGQWLGGIWDAPWWVTRAKSGGQIVEQVSHFFDTLRYLVGEVKRVSGGLGAKGLVTDLEGYDLHDAATVNLQFANGVVGNVSNTCIAPRAFRLQMTFVGRKFVLDLSIDQLRMVDGDRETVIRNHAGAERASHVARLDQTFIESVCKGDPSPIRSTYADALRTLELAQAVQRSIDTGEAVILSDPQSVGI
jgi:predicted dehydrogenase